MTLSILAYAFDVPGLSLKYYVYFFQFINLFMVDGENDIGVLEISKNNGL